MTNVKQPTTSQSLGSLLKYARDIMRKEKGFTGDIDRLPLSSRSSGLSGRGDILVITGSWGFTPSFHITGLQPVNLPGPKVCHVTAWAGASPTSEGPGQPSPQTSQAL